MSLGRFEGDPKGALEVPLHAFAVSILRVAQDRFN